MEQHPAARCTPVAPPPPHRYAFVPPLQHDAAAAARHGGELVGGGGAQRCGARSGGGGCGGGPERVNVVRPDLCCRRDGRRRSCTGNARHEKRARTRLRIMAMAAL